MNLTSDLSTMLFVLAGFFGLMAGGYFLAVRTLTPKAHDYLLCLVGLPLFAFVLTGVAIMLASISPVVLVIVVLASIIFAIVKHRNHYRTQIAKNNSLDSTLVDEHALKL